MRGLLPGVAGEARNTATPAWHTVAYWFISGISQLQHAHCLFAQIKFYWNTATAGWLYMLSVAVFLIHTVATETVWPTESKVFTVFVPSQKKFADSWFQILVPSNSPSGLALSQALYSEASVYSLVKC